MAASGIPASVCSDKWQLSHKCLSLGENGVSSHRPPHVPPSWPGHSESRLPSTEKSTKTRDRGRESERTWSLERAADGGWGAGSLQRAACPPLPVQGPRGPHIWLQRVGLLPWPGILPAAGSRAACPFPSLERQAPIGCHLPETRDRGAVGVTVDCPLGP